MKILLCPDHIHDHWSAYNRCCFLKKYITKHNFDILGGLDKETLNQQLDFANKYDFVHIHFTGCLEYWYPFYKKFPEKLLITIINERSFADGFEIDIEKASEMVYGCCLASSVGKRMANHFNIDYIPNGVDLSIFKEPKSIKVGYSGTERKNKNVELLKEVCKDLGLELVTATYEGNRLSHDQMYKFYKEIDVYVHPSLTEGNSNVVLEALSMNCPVLMTRQGVWFEYEGYADFFEPYYANLYEKLKKYKSRSLIEQKFQWKDICKKYERFYERAAAKQKLVKEKNERN